ncbi:MAG: T9SS type A sorting domain-containing protein [bacterium]
MIKDLLLRFSLLAMLVLLIDVGLSAQNQFLNETFSSGALPNGWTDQVEDSSTASWNFEQGAAVFNGGNKYNSSASFITEEIDLSDVILPYLSFNITSPHSRGVTDSLVVSYRTSSSSIWTTFIVSTDIYSTSTNYQYYLTDKMQNEGFQLKFEAFYRFGGGITIDDIFIINSIACTTAPSNIRVSALGGDTVSLLWNFTTYSDSTHLMLTTSEITDFANIDDDVIVVDTMLINQYIGMVTLRDLSVSTKYYAYLQCDCGSGDVTPYASTSFQIPCEAIVVEDIYTESFEDGFGCWAESSSTGDVAQVTNTRAYDGKKSLYFNVDANEYSYIVAPFDVDLSEMEISMYMYANTISDNLSAEINIGIVDNLGDLSDITDIKSLELPLEGVWYNIIVDLNGYTGDGKYIVLYTGNSERANQFWLDYIQVQEASDCYAPMLQKVTDVRAHSAQLDWADVSTSSSFNIYVSTKSLSSTQLDEVSDGLIEVNATSYLLNDLEATTKYYVYLQSGCGMWLYEPLEFTTLSSIELGFYDEFDYSSIQSTWYYGNLVYDREASTWTEYPYWTSGYETPNIYENRTNTGSAGGSLRLYANYTNMNNPFVILPELHKDIDINNIQLSFYAYISKLDEPFTVSICEGMDISTAVAVDTLYPSEASVFAKYILSFEDYKGSGRNIVFSSLLKRFGTDTRVMFVDDLSLEELDPCNAVHNTTAKDITLNKATITWSAPGASSYDIELYTEEKTSTSVALGTFTSTASSYTFTNLDMVTRYYAYVRINQTECPDADWSEYIYFRTAEELVVPYFNDFTDEPIGAISRRGPEGWVLYSPYDSDLESDARPYIDDTPWYVNTGVTLPYEISANSLRLNHNSEMIYAIMPIAADEVNISNLNISFYGYAAGADECHAVIVGIMESNSDVNTFEPIDTISVFSTYNTASLYNISTAGYTGTGKYIAFKGFLDGYTENDFYIDNLSITDASDCVAVTNVIISNITPTSLYVSWDDENSTSFNVVLLDGEGTVMYEESGIAVNYQSITGVSLEANTIYTVEVQAVSGDCTARWVVASFDTGCDAVRYPMPFTEDFNTQTTGVGNAPECWYLKSYTSTYAAYIMDATSTYPDATYGASYGATLYMYGYPSAYNYAIMPAMDSIQHTTLEFKVYTNLATTYESYVEVGIMESVDDSFKDPSVYSTYSSTSDNLFTPITTYYLSSSKGWETVTIDFSTYEGEGNRIAFRNGNYSHVSTSYTRVLIDNITVSKADCPLITDITVGEITTSSITLSWTQLDEPAWDIKVGTSAINFTDDEELVLDTRISSNTYTIESLESSTTYYIYIRRVNATNDCEGEWSEVMVVTTECASIEVPYNDNFEDNTATGTSAETKCWSVWGTSDVTAYPVAHSLSVTGQASATGDTRCLALENTSSSTDGISDLRYTYAVLPEANVTSLKEVVLSFRAYNPSSTGGQFDVGAVYASSNNDIVGDTYVSVATGEIPKGVWTYYRISFENLENNYLGEEGKFITIMALPGDETTSNIFYIDDVSVTYADTDCAIPTQFEVLEYGASKASVGWQNAGTEGTRIVVSNVAASDIQYLDDASIIIDTLLAPTATTYNFLIDPSTNYYVFASTKCGDDYSYAALASFKSTEGIPMYEPFAYTSNSDGLLDRGWILYGTIDFVYYPTTADTTINCYGNDGIIEFPEFDSYFDVKDLGFSFETLGYDGDDYSVIIGVLEIPGTESSFAGIDTISIPYVNGGDLQTIDVNLSSYTGSSRTLAMKLNDIADIYIDDFYLYELKPCTYNLDVTVSELFDDAVTLKFDPVTRQESWVVVINDEPLTEEQLEVVTEDDVVYMTTTSDTYLTVSSLSNNTTYYVYINSECYYVAEWSEVFNFVTLSTPIDVAYSESFESFSANDFPELWALTSGNAYVSTDINDPDCGDSDVTLFMESGSVLTLPYFIPSLNLLNLSFDVASPTDAMQIEVGIISNSLDASTFQSLQTFTVVGYESADAAIANYFSYNFENYSGIANFIAIRAVGGDAYIDDVLVDYASGICETPLSLEVSLATVGVAEVTWENLNSTVSTQILVGTRNVSSIAYLLDDDLIYAAKYSDGSTSYQFPVDAHSVYYIYARSYCDGNGTSPLVKCKLETGCMPVEIPYYDSMDYATEEEFTDAGWQLLAGTSISSLGYVADFANTTTDTVLTVSGGSDGVYIQLPDFDPRYDLKDIILEFDAVSFSSTATRSAYVGTLETSGDYTSFKSYKSITLPKLGSTSYSFTVDFSDYTGSSENIVIYVNNTAKSVFDDFHMYTLCALPSDILISDVTDVSATLSFEPFSGHDSWSVVLAESEMTAEELDAATEANVTMLVDMTTYAPVMFTDLEQQTDYYVYVKGSCEYGGDWSSVTTFTTEITKMTLPYFEEFTEVSTGYLPTGWYRSNSNMEDATVDFVAETSATYKYIAVQNIDDIESSPLLVTSMSNATTDYAWAISPEIVVDEDALLLFDLIYEDAGDQSDLDADQILPNPECKVLISLDGFETWQEVASYVDDAKVMYDMFDYKGDTIRFAIYIDTYEAADVTVYIDNISINCVVQDEYKDVVRQGYDYLASSYTIPYTAFDSGDDYESDLFIASSEVGVCDSIISLSLKVLETVVTNITGEICAEGSVYDANGFVQSYPGVYLNVAVLESGADSLTYLTLTAREANPITYKSETICEGYELVFGDTVLTTSGTYTGVFADSFGCDSIIELTLSVTPTITTALSDKYLCEGETYQFGDETLSVSGTYSRTLVAASGCDSVETIKIIVIGNETTYVVDTICSGGVYTIYGEEFTESGVYPLTVTTDAGCEGNIELTLTVLETSYEYIEAAICEGETYEFNEQLLSTSGEVKANYIAANGCDSIVTLTLTVHEVAKTNLGEQLICDGDSYTYNGVEYTESDEYSVTFTSVETGCDSIVSFILIVLGDDIIEQSHTMCEGETYEFDGNQLTVGGTYERTVVSDGCETTIQLTLTVTPIDTIYETETIALDKLPYTFGGKEYDLSTEVGGYADTVYVSGDDGCIDVIIYVLTVIEGDVAVDNVMDIDITMYPNPLSSGQLLYIDAEFTAEERDGMVIEVMNMVGQRIISASPTTDPITINGLTQSGVYIVRITTGTGVQHLGKVIVK